MDSDSSVPDPSMGFLLLIQVILIALNAVFASAEIAVLSINDAKLAKLVSEGNKKAKRLSRLTSQPAKFLATIQVAITLSGFLGSAFAADNFSDYIVDWMMGLGIGISRSTLNTIAVILITLLLSYFTLIFGELVPKRIAMKKSEQLALGISGLINGISVLFAPIVWFLSVSTNAVLRLLGISPEEEEDQISEEEIRMMVDAGSEKGTIDHEEREFIQNVFEFNDLTAEEIATHRTDVDLLWLEDSDEDWAGMIHSTRHTRYPVCEDSKDNIVGILNAKDYFRLEDKSRENVMENAVKSAYFVPESIKADVLFRNMKKTGNSLAVVLDEYGGMVGIVTLNDLIEQLVGDLSDEEENQAEDAPGITQNGEDTWLIRGNVRLSEIEEETGVKLDSEEYDTFTGFVFDCLGEVPGDGQQDIELEIPPVHIHVSRIEEHQVAEASIRLTKETAKESESNA